MKKRTAVIGALVSLLPMGQPLVIGTGAALTSTALILAVPKQAQAESEDFYFQRGNNRIEEGDNYGAISDFEKVLKLNPNNYAALHNIGLVKGQKLGDIKGAIVDFNKAIVINPEYSDAFFNRGVAKLFLKDNYGAISDLLKALETDSQNPQRKTILWNLGLAKSRIGDMKGACYEMRKASSLGEEDAPKWVKKNC
mgnify:CR=1 FL=1